MRSDRIYDDQPSTPLIFVVEDDRDIASLIAHTVKGAGFAPRVFLDGQLVVEAAQEQLPALILLDLMLPSLDGMEILRCLESQQRTREIRKIILSARGSELDKVRALELGADDYITKPIDFDILTAIINARLARVARTAIWPRTIDLTDREVQTLTWAARGKTSSEIATIVGLTKRTVDFHIDNARLKLNASTRMHAAVKAAVGQLIDP